MFFYSTTGGPGLESRFPRYPNLKERKDVMTLQRRNYKTARQMWEKKLVNIFRLYTPLVASDLIIDLLSYLEDDNKRARWARLMAQIDDCLIIWFNRATPPWSYINGFKCVAIPNFQTRPTLYRWVIVSRADDYMRDRLWRFFNQLYFNSYCQDYKTVKDALSVPEGEQCRMVEIFTTEEENICINWDCAPSYTCISCGLGFANVYD